MAKSDWTKKIDELEAFFKSVELPKTIKLSEHENIVFTKLFVMAGLCLCRSNNGNPTYIPYATRLNRLKEVLTNQNKTNVKKNKSKS